MSKLLQIVQYCHFVYPYLEDIFLKKDTHVLDLEKIRQLESKQLCCFGISHLGDIFRAFLSFCIPIFSGHFSQKKIPTFWALKKFFGASLNNFAFLVYSILCKFSMHFLSLCIPIFGRNFSQKRNSFLGLVKILCACLNNFTFLVYLIWWIFSSKKIPHFWILNISWLSHYILIWTGNLCTSNLSNLERQQ
jgi:hypothetical protein